MKIIDTSAGLNAQYLLKDSVEITNSPNFNLGADTAVCANANYKLETVVAPGYTYLWQDNSTGHFLMPQKSGTYSCMVKNKMGCFYADTVQLVIKPLAIPKFDYTVNKTQVIFADSSKNANGILWKFGDNTTSNQLNPVHNYPDLGTYTAWQIVSNSCNTDSVSHTIIINQTRVKMFLGEGNMVLYPNPTAGLIYLENLHEWNAAEIKIYAANGKEISNNCTYHYFNGKLQVDLTSVADGIYIVQVVQNAHSTSYSIVKQMH
ncbi:MAG: T9SS type A sorting domain-containing protein [Bacteroidia bacterium]|nr:T9SS type A sorting domain-containing protein [Bacteroidia bacterium]